MSWEHFIKHNLDHNEAQEINDPQRKWKETLRRLDKVVDKRGMPIDAGIKETVAALQCLGFETEASCEGHLHRNRNHADVGWKSLAPWVQVSFLPAGLRERIRQAQKRAGGRWNDAQVQHLVKEGEAAMGAGATQIFALLDEFYRQRNVPFERRLILDFYPDSVRLESQGTEMQQYCSPETQEEKLKDFREELAEFTEFMKQRFFSQAQQTN